MRHGRLPRWAAVFGPGLLVMLADSDAGNIVTAADAGARWGFRLLLLPLLLIPVLAAVQDLAVRIGLSTGCGFGALVRARCGPGIRVLAGVALASATLGSLATEFTGVAGVGELFGLPRLVSVAGAGAGLLAIVLAGRDRVVERVAILVGLLELAFVLIAWALHPAAATLAADIADQPLGDPGYLWLGAALIGATFNPWMIFYQGSALARRRLGPVHSRAARLDTWLGAILTQVLTAAVLLAAASAIGHRTAPATLTSVGQISQTLTPVLGPSIGRALFGLGVVGASFAAAIVCTLACRWGLAELTGPRGAGRELPLAWSSLGTVGFVAGAGTPC